MYLFLLLNNLMSFEDLTDNNIPKHIIIISKKTKARSFTNLIFIRNQLFIILKHSCCFFVLNTFHFLLLQGILENRSIQIVIHLVDVCFCIVSVGGRELSLGGVKSACKDLSFAQSLIIICKLEVATLGMAFLDLNLHVLQLATSNSNNLGPSVVQNYTSAWRPLQMER